MSTASNVSRGDRIWNAIQREFWTFRPLAASVGMLFGIAACWMFRVVTIDWPLWEHLIVNLSQALAWPLAAVGIAVVFKRQIARLFERLENLEAMGSKASFAKGVVGEDQAVGGQVREPTATTTTTTPDPGYPEALRERLRALAETNARAAIIDAWREVHDAGNRILIRKKMEPRATYQGLIKTLEQLGALNEEIEGAIDQLRVVRNRCVHEQRYYPGVDDALTYIDRAIELVRKLDGM